MHSLGTAARQHGKGHRFTAVVFSFLALVFLMLGPNPVHAAKGPIGDPLETGSLPAPDWSNEQMRHAPVGNEGLILAAKLRADGNYVNRPIHWQIFRHDAQMATIGEKVFDRKSATALVPLPPGDYVIEANYGFAHLKRRVHILPQTELAITFNLQVGGVRVLSSVSGTNATHYARAHHAIFRLDGKKRGPVTKAIGQGEIVRLPAGTYRIESQFEGGNTTATAEVTIKAGILTSLNMAHTAAFARLTVQSKEGQKTNWRIVARKWNWQRVGKGRTASMVLAPGTYTFTAKVGEKTYTNEITLPAGKATLVILGRN